MPPRGQKVAGQVHLKLSESLYARLESYVEKTRPQTTFTGAVEFLLDKALRDEKSKKA